MTVMEDAKPSVRNWTVKITKEKRAYGKAPLELDLPQALDAINRIAQEGKSMGESKLAIILGNTVTSSAFTRKIRSLIAYGLLSEQPDEQFALSDLALSIAFPRSPEAQVEGKKTAFLKIEQFSFLFNQHKGKLLPADEFLRNILEQECNIPRDGSDVWVRQFKEGARASGLFYIRADGKTQISESPMLGEIVQDEPVPVPLPKVERVEKLELVRSDGDGSGSLAYPSHEMMLQPQVWSLPASGHCTRIELSDGRRAEFGIPDKLSAKDAEKLKKALQGISVIIDSMVSEPDKPKGT